MSETRLQAERARSAFLKLSTSVDRSQALSDVAAALSRDSDQIFAANRKDLDAARDTLSTSLYKRLILDEPKLRDVIAGIRQLAEMPDPIGQVLAETELDDADGGLILRKVQTPIGVIAAIFESRPEVVAQIAALALRTGNAVLLKGGSDAAFTNAVVAGSIRSALEKHSVGDAVQLVTTREQVAELLGMDDLISLVVPRGSNEMVRHIQANTRIPVLGHAAGVCHVYLDESADIEKAVRIAVDAKAQYPAVCNVAETLLVHSGFPGLQQVAAALRSAGVELRGCSRTVAQLKDAVPAKDTDFGFEFSDLILALKIVDNLDEAIAHIHRYGSAHTECIVTEDKTSATRFLNEVDAAGVYWNASTRFADGFRYGFGAEVGISTNKTHARGPVGIEGLLIYKYHLVGNGHIVATYAGENARKFTHRKRSPKN